MSELIQSKRVLLARRTRTQNREYPKVTLFVGPFKVMPTTGLAGAWHKAARSLLPSLQERYSQRRSSAETRRAAWDLWDKRCPLHAISRQNRSQNSFVPLSSTIVTSLDPVSNWVLRQQFLSMREYENSGLKFKYSCRTGCLLKGTTPRHPPFCPAPTRQLCDFFQYTMNLK